jgi:hypothetical protein
MANKKVEETNGIFCNAKEPNHIAIRAKDIPGLKYNSMFGWMIVDINNWLIVSRANISAGNVIKFSVENELNWRGTSETPPKTGTVFMQKSTSGIFVKIFDDWAMLKG